MKIPASKHIRFLLIAMICFVLFAIFGAMVVYHFGLEAVDLALTDTLFHFTLARPTLWNATIFVTDLGTGDPLWIVGTVIVIGWLLRRDWWMALIAMLGMLTCRRLSPYFKGQFERPRPLFEDSIFRWGNDSFPSGHAFGTAVIYCMLAWLLWNVWSGSRLRHFMSGSCFVFIAMVMISRLMIGVHHLTDVLAGTCLGAGWVCLWLSIANWRRDRGAGNLT